jgi:hypothetical protein
MGGTIAAPRPGGGTDPATPAERQVSWAIAAVLVLSTLFFTVLHHGFPGVFDVPPNQGVPFMDFPTMFALDLIPVALAWLCFRHALHRRGLFPAMIFLGGSFVFTGVEESMWILLGRYHLEIQASLGGPAAGQAAFGEGIKDVGGTYYFTRGFFWFLETPLLACLGWFFVAYSCVYVADLLLPRAKTVFRAGLGGLLAMDLDLWLDPVQTSPTFQSWVWVSPDRINLFSIPLSNFMGWFLLIFIFAIVFERLPGMVSRWGPAKAAIAFYGLLMGLEIGILVFFGLYGAVAMRLIPHPLNFTLWGI